MPVNENALRGLLGLCQRAGCLKSGTDMAVNAIRAGKARLAVVDEEASGNTKKRISDACIYYHVPLQELPPDLLGGATGKSGRMAAAVTDAGFAAKIGALLKQNQAKIDDPGVQASNGEV
ncbi:MAG: ribosomal L7Ae/L30e/S12e/Gadd45 family protein [Clostridia bacterium]|nr:ribosomal L7Ae/L30e/S12e/Gadd45 family protein [Clostridia bacterium]